MRRYFVIGIDSATKNQSDAIKEWLESDDKFGWWHWIEGLWLVTSHGDMNSEQIRDKILDIIPDIRNLVIEVHPQTWYGYGPKGENYNMFTWLHDYWGK